MRAVLQRVSSASVRIDGLTRGSIQQGILVLLGVGPADTPEDGEWLAQKISKLRIFPDYAGQMNRSLLDIDGGLLVVSQFTLFASTRKGTRPSFNDAAPPTLARELYEKFLGQASIALNGKKIECGEFAAMMEVSLTNDGPVTLLLDTKNKE